VFERHWRPRLVGHLAEDAAWFAAATSASTPPMTCATGCWKTCPPASTCRRPEDLPRRLYELSQAIVIDYDGFQALMEDRRNKWEPAERYFV
jgi:hypothetical protein